jgi:hypothetical protein
MAAISSILSGVDWNDVLKTIGSTAVVVAILGFLAQATIKHFLDRNIEVHKADLKRAADQELADAKARVDAALLTQKAAFDRQMEAFKSDLATRTARDERIRQEVVRWANPILGSVLDLQRRLDNILNKEAYLVLSPTSKDKINSEWSITYDYFLPSTVFLLSQYFCWVHLLEEKLSFELFEKHAEKDAFFDKVRAVGRTLSSFPLKELAGISGTGDRQVFGMQQRAMGERLAVADGLNTRCMRYSDFLEKWTDSAFRTQFDALTQFVDRLEPSHGGHLSISEGD